MEFGALIPTIFNLPETPVFIYYHIRDTIFNYFFFIQESVYNLPTRTRTLDFPDNPPTPLPLSQITMASFLKIDNSKDTTSALSNTEGKTQAAHKAQ